MRVNRFLRIVAIGVSTALMAGVLAGCGGTKEANEIAIGANLELTGASADFGPSTQRGVELAIEHINAQGGLLGKTVRLISIDNQSNASETAKGMKNLAGQRVSAIVGPDTTGCALAAAKVSQDCRVPIISPTGSNPQITVDPTSREVYRYMFRTTFVDPVQGRAMAGFARKRLSAMTAAVLYDAGNEYSSGLADFFREAFAADGGSVTDSIAYDSSAENFKESLQQVMAGQPDVLYVPDYYPKALVIIQQAREAGITIPILGADGWDSNGMEELARKALLSGLYYTGHYSLDTPDPDSAGFIKDYEDKFGMKPDNYAALGYDSVMIVADAIRRGNSAKPDSIRDELAKTIDYAGVTGRITLDANHDAVKDVFILAYNTGLPHFVEKVKS